MGSKDIQKLGVLKETSAKKIIETYLNIGMGCHKNAMTNIKTEECQGQVKCD